MTAQELISASIPILKHTDAVSLAIEEMNEYKISHLPIVENDLLVSLISEDDLLDLPDEGISLNDAHLKEFIPQINADAHILDAIKIFSQFNLTVLPVLDVEQKYLGSISIDAVLKYYYLGSQCVQNGGIILLEIDPRNYSLSEVARICESDNVNILSVLQHTNSENGMMLLTIKTNRQDLNSVVASFERFNYSVLGVFAESFDKEIIKNNYDALMHYINM